MKKTQKWGLLWSLYLSNSKKNNKEDFPWYKHHCCWFDFYCSQNHNKKFERLSRSLLPNCDKFALNDKWIDSMNRVMITAYVRYSPYRACTYDLQSLFLVWGNSRRRDDCFQSHCCSPWRESSWSTLDYSPLSCKPKIDLGHWCFVLSWRLAEAEAQVTSLYGRNATPLWTGWFLALSY